ncbi:MAG: MFS transporter [Spirochaetales bacterium]|nr:MFS transporter [Spirochaetales bacterium]
MTNGKKKKLPFILVMLGLVSFFTDAATEMMYPLIPAFLLLLGAGPLVLGVIEGVAETTASMLKLVVGIVSDKMKKKKLFVVAGYAISTFIRPLTSIVGNGWQIVFVRMADRIGKGIRTSPRDALIAASTSEDIRGKSFGFHRAMDHAGAVIGPILALLMLVVFFSISRNGSIQNALRFVFAFSIVPGLFAVLILVLFVREKKGEDSKSSGFSFSLSRFDRNYIFYLFIVILFTLGNSSDAFLLFRVEEVISKTGIVYEIAEKIPVINYILGLISDPGLRIKLVNILVLPLIWSFFHILKALFSTPLSALSDKIGRKKVINIGWAVYALVYTGFAFVDRIKGAFQFVVILILFGIYSFYYAFTEGTEKAFVADLTPPEVRGSAYGLYHFSIGLSALPASMLFGLIYTLAGKGGGTAAFLTGAGLALTAMILLTFFIKEKKVS